MLLHCISLSLMYLHEADVAKQLDEGKGLKQTVESVKDANKRGALHFAAREGQTEVCRYLLEELKLDANTKDEAGDTPLVHAARQGQIDTAKYLLDHGADPNIASELGATALHHAAGTGLFVDYSLVSFTFHFLRSLKCCVFGYH